MPDQTLPAVPAGVPGQKRVLLSDLLNTVLDKGLVVAGSVTIAVADVDLIQLDLTLLLSAIETAVGKTLDASLEHPATTTGANKR